MNDGNCTGFQVLPKNQVCQATNLLTNVTPEKEYTGYIDSVGETSPILQSSFTYGNKNNEFCSSTPASIHRGKCSSEEKSTDFVLNVLDRLCSPISRQKTPGNKRCTLPEKSCSNAGIKYTLLSPLKQDSATECNVNNCADDNNITDFFKEHDISENTLQVLCQATSHIVNKQIAETAFENVSSNKITCHKSKQCSFPSSEVSLSKFSKDEVVSKSLSSYTGKTSLASGTIDDNHAVIYHSILSPNKTTQISLNDLLKSVKELEEANVPIIINQEVCNQNVNVHSSTKESEPSTNLRSESNCGFKRFLEDDSQADFISVNDSVSITDTQFCEVAETAEIIDHITCQSIPSDCSKNNKKNTIYHELTSTSSIFNSTEINTESSVPVIPQIRKISSSSKCQTGKYFPNCSKLSINDCNYAKHVNLNCLSSANVAEELTIVKDNSLVVSRKLINNFNETRNSNEIKKIVTDDENRLNVTKELSEMLQSFDNNNQTTLKPYQQKRHSIDFDKTSLVNKDSLQVAKQLHHNKSEIEKPAHLNGKKVCITENSLGVERPLNSNGYKSEFEDFYKVCGKTLGVNQFEESLKTAKQFFDSECASTKPYHEFKGFCTAGGKAVKVSEDALKIARQLFDDSSENIKPPEEFNKCSRADDEEICGINMSPKGLEELSYNKGVTTNSELKEFSTASIKAVKVYEDSVNTARRFFDNDCEFTKPEFKGFCTAGKTVNISDDSLKIARLLFESELVCNSSATKNSELTGFSTTSGKAVTVSEESLNTVQFFDNECKSTDTCEFKGFCKAGGKDVNVSEDFLKIERQLFDDNNETIKLPDRYNKCSEDVTINSELKGFFTDTSTAVNLSEQSLKTVKQFFHNECESTKPGFKGFCTAGGKTVNVSDASLKIARRLFDNDNETTKPEEFKGYTTTDGKHNFRTKVCPTVERKLVCNSNATKNSELKGFSTASGKEVNILEESLTNAKHFFDNECKSTDTYEFKGFRTAGGKAVKVSEDSLKVAKQLFDVNNDTVKPLDKLNRYSIADDKKECRIEMSPKFGGEPIHTAGVSTNPELKGFTTASSKAVMVSEESPKTTKPFFHNEFESTKPGFKGFCTAGGRTVNVSDDSLRIARRLFDNDSETANPSEEFKGYSTTDGKNNFRTKVCPKVERKLVCNSNATKNSELKGFSTASGKEVNILEESLTKAKHFIDNECKSTDTYEFKGFRTAGGKAVKISEDSLKVAKQLFDVNNDTVKPLDKLNRYSTADDKKECRIEMSPKFGGEPIHTAGVSTNPELKGFTTASSKAVMVSEESPKTTKPFFHNEFESTKPGFKGFCTAGGRTVNVSDDSLKIARRLFDNDSETAKPSEEFNGYSTTDGENNFRTKVCPKVEKELICNSNTTKISEMKGFSTAIGKDVNISNESLKTAKHFVENKCKSTNTYEFEGFCTAGGKAVKVSEDSLKIAKQLYDDSSETTQPLDTFSWYFTAYDEKYCRTEVSPNVLGELSYNKDVITNSELKGLSTASGKAVNISEQSLKTAKQFCHKECAFTKPKLNDFCTAVEKTININNEDSLNITTQIFDHADGTVGYNNKSELTKLSKIKGCFPVAVHIPENSSKITQFLFNNEKKLTKLPKLKECCDTSSEIIKDYSTTDDKAIHVTKDSLKKARNVFHSGIEISNYPSIGEFCPEFGKVVHISDESLKTENNLFKNDVGSKELPTTVFNDDSIITDLSKSKIFQSSCHFDTTKEPERVFKPYEIKGTPFIELGHTNLQDESTTKRFCDCHLTYFGSKQDVGQDLSHCSIKGNMCKRVKIEDLNIVSNKRRKLFHDYDQHHNTTLNHSNIFPYLNTSSLMSVISEDDLSLLNHSSTVLKNRLNSSFSKNFRDEGENQLYSTELSPSIAREVSECTAALIADDKSNSSFLLKPCVSSPAIIFDRETNLPSISCYEKESNINDKQLSPVLDNFSHFKAHHSLKNNHTKCKLEHTNINGNKNNTPQTKSCSFKPPYVTSTPNEISIKHEKVKRLLADSNYYTPFIKRFKMDKSHIENINVDELSRLTIIEARKMARKTQELYIQENHRASGSCKGFLLMQKQSKNCVSLKYLSREHPVKLYAYEELIQLGVKSSVIGITRNNADSFKFDIQDYFSLETALNNVDGIPLGDDALLILDDEGKAGVEEFTRAFMASPAVDPTLISSEWVRNHFLWIVWKLAAMEKLFPKHLSNRYLTPNNVMLQLKYRYDREIDRCQRAALRKILEKDESPAKPMVLFVADIIKVTIRECEERIELELSDGWYSVIASIDHEMEVMVKRRIVCVGTKLLISGADITGINDGCHPLEKPPDVRLRVSTNSTRRARWYARLGWSSITRPPTRLRGVLGRGGTIPAITAVVARTYCLLYLERFQEGKSVLRSERAEQIAADNYELKRQQCAETILNQLQLDLERSKSSHKQPVSFSYIKTVKSNTELYSILKEVDDISIYQDILSKEQISVIEELGRDEASRIQLQLQEKLAKLLDQKMPPRSIRRMIKVRLADSENCFDHSALLTVWNPSDDVLALLTEGNSLVFYNLSASGYSRYGELLLTGGKQTRFSQEKHCVVLRNPTPIQELQNPDIKPPFSEIDVVGVVVLISNSSIGTNSNQVYIADSDFNFLGISFHSNIKDTGYGNIINLGSFIAVSNLHWRSNLVSWSLPTAFATETSTFSQHPRQSHLINALKELKAQPNVLDLDSYLDSCREKIKSLILQRNSGGLSSATKSTSIVSSSNLKESVISTPDLNVSADVDLLRRPDSKSRVLFDGTVDNNCDTPINKKIVLLGRFGEPPPISPLPITTPTRVKQRFRPPQKNIDEKR